MIQWMDELPDATQKPTTEAAEADAVPAPLPGANGSRGDGSEVGGRKSSDLAHASDDGGRKSAVEAAVPSAPGPAGGSSNSPTLPRSGGNEHHTRPGYETRFPVAPKMGMRWTVDKQDNDDSRIILDRSWPTQAQQHVRGKDGAGPGYGTCLGATYERGVARMGKFTNDMSDIVVRLNILIEKYVSNFKWTSIQVNIDTVSLKHTDSNNEGPQ